MMDAERRVLKAKRVYEDACERFRQKESGIKRLHQKILSKVYKSILNYHGKNNITSF